MHTYIHTHHTHADNLLPPLNSRLHAYIHTHAYTCRQSLTAAELKTMLASSHVSDVNKVHTRIVLCAYARIMLCVYECIHT